MITDGVSGLAKPGVHPSPSALVRALVGFNSFGRATFDRYPFNLLTLAVSRSRVLTGFVLMAQSRMTQQADSVRTSICKSTCWPSRN